MEKEINNKAMTLGLDLGVSSIGWCLYESNKKYKTDSQGEVERDKEGNFKCFYSPQHIIDLGVFVFNQIEDGKSGKTENVQRREKRLMRRQRRRKARRLYSLRRLFYKYFHVDFLNDVITPRHCKLTPFEIKIKGIDNKLTQEELMIALYHYMKYRGFESNRKAKDSSGDDNKKMLGGIKATQKALSENNLYISQYLVSKQEERIEKNRWDNQIHNRGGNYIFTVSREDYEKEIIKLLDSQIKYGVIDINFKNDFLGIYRKRRSYTDGPNDPSPFKVDFEGKIGNCFIYKDEKRAPKDSLTAQRFVLLSKLVNFRYRYTNINTEEKKNNEYLSLTVDQIKTIEDNYIFDDTIKYSKILKCLKLDKDNIEIKGLILTKKEYSDLRKKFSKTNHLESEIKIESDEELNKKFQKELKDKYFDKIFFRGSKLINEIYKCKKIPNNLKTDDFYDDVAETFLVKKDDKSISNKLSEYSINKNIIEELLNIEADATKTIDLSIKLCKELIPYLRDGLTYDKAMDKCGHNHSDKKLDLNDGNGIIPPIDEALKEINIVLANPVVKNTLIQLRKVLNAITKKYGQIDDCIVELARELKLSFKERRELLNEQIDNQSKNNLLRNEMIEKYPQYFRSYNDISKDFLIKYKLFREQNGTCVYTNTPIKENELFDKNKNEYQIDHIIPYHLSFDDSYANKVLVKTSANQEKGMRIPMECHNISKNVKLFLENHPYISKTKKNNLLKMEVDEEFKKRDLNDTSYLSKIARDLITYFVLKKGSQCRTNSGGITDFLRKHWGLSGKIHTYYPLKDNTYASFENKMYQSKFYDDFKLVQIEPNLKNDVAESIKFYFENGSNKNTIDIKKIQEKKDKKTGESTLSFEEKTLNFAIDDFAKNYLVTFKIFQNNNWRNKSVEDIQELISGERQSFDNEYSAEYSKHLEFAMLILGKVREEIQKIIDEKNRDNHLHHALDAAIIGVCTQSLVYKISNANKDNNTDKIVCPQPYKDFDKEVLIRVYEHDENKLLYLLNNNVEYYKKYPLSKYDAHILIPVRQPNHNIKGALTKETIYGAKMLDGELIATKRINVKEMKKDDIEKIIDKDNGNKAVYESIKEWFHDKISEYPKLKQKGTYIKSVKISSGLAETKVSLSKDNNRFADNDTVARVEVYRKKNSNNGHLYFVPIYYYQLLERAKKENDKIKYIIMYNRDNCIPCSGIQLEKEFDKIAILPKYSLIEIILKNGKRGLAYSGGLTSGSFEVYSPVGDFYDTNKELKDSSDDRLRITCSTIKSIKVHNISVLGKVS